MREKIRVVVFSRWAPWIIFFLSLITRLIGAYLGGNRNDDSDQVYVRMAVHFLSGQGFSLVGGEFGRVYSWLPPGMGFLNVIFYSLFGQNELIIRAIFVVMSALANVSLFCLAKRLLKVEYAFLAALVWAIYPPQWFWASRINPHTYATNIMIFSIHLLFFSWERKSYWMGMAVGLLWATASLCRGEYALGFLVLAGATLIRRETSSFVVIPAKAGIQAGNLLLKGRSETWIPAFAGMTGILMATSIIFGWALGFAPWVARNYSIHHRFVLIATNDGDNFWKAYNPAYQFRGEDIPFPPELLGRLRQEPNEVGRADILKREAFRFIRENPGRAIRNVTGNLLNFWRPWLSRTAVSAFENGLYLASYVPLLVLFVLGLFKVPWRDPHWRVVVGLLVYKWVIHGPFYVIVQFRESVMPLMALVAVLFIQWYFQKGENSSHA